jgi:hypothetical protein
MVELSRKCVQRSGPRNLARVLGGRQEDLLYMHLGNALLQFHFQEIGTLKKKEVDYSLQWPLVSEYSHQYHVREVRFGLKITFSQLEVALALLRK